MSRKRRGSHATLLAGSILVSLLLAESVLYVLDTRWDFSGVRPRAQGFATRLPQVPELYPGFITDEVNGSRYHPSEPGINAQGFRDRDNFDAGQLKAALRVLLIGDSFSYGAAAVYDGSFDGFADKLEAMLKQQSQGGAVVWNTGIPGTAPNEQKLHLLRFLPRLRPQVVILQLFENDLHGVMWPPAAYYVFADGTWGDRYRLDDSKNFQALSPRDTWLRAKSYPLNKGPALCSLRFTSVLLRWSLCSPPGEQMPAGDPLLTLRQEIGEIVEASRSHGARVIALAIPAPCTVSGSCSGQNFQDLIEAVQGLQISLVDASRFVTADHYTAAPDLHWTKEAHQRAAAALADVVYEPGTED